MHECRPLPKFTEEQIKRFWPRVDKRGPEECRPWTGAVSAKGYGVFFAGRSLNAHRTALILSSGVDSPLLALHSCDNRPCCNPAHLRWGTALDNETDKISRGRRPLQRHNRRFGFHFAATVRRWLSVIGEGYCYICRGVVSLANMRDTGRCGPCDTLMQRRLKAARLGI